MTKHKHLTAARAGVNGANLHDLLRSAFELAAEVEAERAGLQEQTMDSAALAKAQAARRKAAKAYRKTLQVPAGCRSMEHFLDSVRERAGLYYGGQGELARYLGTNRKSVSRWLAREQYPLQATIDAMSKWYASKQNKMIPPRFKAPDAECSPGDPARFGAMIDAQIEARLELAQKRKRKK